MSYDYNYTIGWNNALRAVERYNRQREELARRQADEAESDAIKKAIRDGIDSGAFNTSDMPTGKGLPLGSKDVTGE